MFADLPVKAMIYLAMLTAVIAGITAGYNAIEQSGYDRRQAEELNAFNEQLNEINEKHKDELEKAKHEAEHFRQVAVLLQNAEPIVITKWKEKVIYANPNCTRLDGFGVMWNKSLERFNL